MPQSRQNRDFSNRSPNPSFYSLGKSLSDHERRAFSFQFNAENDRKVTSIETSGLIVEDLIRSGTFTDDPCRIWRKIAYLGDRPVERKWNRSVYHWLGGGDEDPAVANGAKMIDGGQSRMPPRQPSLLRLSSESSYAGSLFSGATPPTTSGDGSASTDAKDLALLSGLGGGGGGGAREEGNRTSWVQKARESYYLQLTFAIRLASQASLVDETHLLRDGAEEICGVSLDAETVSYRLWVCFFSLKSLFLSVSVRWQY